MGNDDSMMLDSLFEVDALRQIGFGLHVILPKPALPPRAAQLKHWVAARVRRSPLIGYIGLAVLV